MSRFLLALVLFFFNASAAYAQDDAEVMVRLTPEQEKTFREVLAKPIDQTTLYTTQAVAYKEKIRAAMMLGESSQQEENLLAWSRIDPDGLWNLRSFYTEMGRHDKAIAVAQQIIPSTTFPPSAARIRVYMAMNYLSINDTAKAKTLFEEAEAFLREGTSRFPRAQAGWLPRAQTEFYMFKSVYELRLGHTEEAMALATLAIEKSKGLIATMGSFDNELYRTYARSTVVRAMGNLVNQQVANGQFIDAQASIRDALKFAKDNGFNQNHMFGFYVMSSDILAGMGQFDGALRYAKMAEKIHLDQGYPKASPNWLRTQSKLLTAMAGLEQWTQAHAVLRESTQVTEGTAFSVDESMNVDTVAMVELQVGQYTQALQRLERKLPKKIQIYGDKHYDTALTTGLLGLAYWKNGQLAQAKTYLRNAKKDLHSPDALTGDFSESAIQKGTTRYIYDGYMKMLVQTARTSVEDAQELFELADLVNGSAVQSALSDAAVRMSINVPGLSDIVRQDQDAKQEFASLITYINNQNSVAPEQRNPTVVGQMRKRMQDIKGLRKEYKAQIQKQYPEYFVLLQPKTPKPDQIAAMLAPDEVFLSIQPMRDETYVWAINASGQTSFHVSEWGEKRTRDAVNRIRKTLDVAEMGGKATRFDEATAAAIYDTFFAPQDKFIKDKKHVIVATSGALANMPFAVLINKRQNEKSATPNDIGWFIKQAAISHVPSASGWLSLKRLSQTAHSTEPLLAWGDPQFDFNAPVAAGATTTRSVVRSTPQRTAAMRSLEATDSDAYLAYSRIPPLPETRDEVLALADILQANSQSDVFLGKAANRASVLKMSETGQLAKKQVVVFATHGLLAGDLPHLSQPALAMAASANPKESPLLTLEDVLSLKLNADWVVLSACNTAGADGKAEEAMSGLARGFFYAGSRSLLVTHWSVESESAMLLTTRTFSAYKKGGTGVRRSEALRQAMLETMKSPKYAHPAFWAPYALVGEGGH